MKNIIGRIITIIILILIPVSGIGQTTTFRGLTMTDGLSDLLVNAIYKDSSGFVWFGSINSVDCFDGIEIHKYPFTNNDTKLKRVYALTETAGKQIWMGNNLGLWVLDRRSDSMIQIANEQIDFPVYSLLYDSKRTLYIGTERGLYLRSNENIKSIMIDKNELAPCNQIRGMTFDKEGNLWLATPVGLYRYQPQTGKITPYLDAKQEAVGLKNVTSTGVMLYVGSEGHGLFSFNTKTGEYKPYLNVGSDVISSLSGDGCDMIYVATDGGGIHFISTLQNKEVRSFRHDVNKTSGIRSNSVYSLLVDKEGIIWIGYYQAGVDYSLYQSGLFETYRHGSFNSGDFVVRSFDMFGKYKVLGTRDGLILVNESNSSIKTYGSSQLHSNVIFSVFYYQNKFYIGTFGGGLKILDPATGAIQSVPFSQDVFRNGSIFRMCKDKSGNLWMAASTGVYCYRPSDKQIVEYTSRNSQLPEGQVYSVFFDSSGRGWFCTENGIAVYDAASKSVKANVFPDGFINKEMVRSMYEDRKHRLYFIPDKGAMFISSPDMKNYSRFHLQPALRSNAYMSVIEDNEGYLWLGSDNGLMRTKLNNSIYSIYGYSDGITSSVFSYAASYKDPEGKLWFGTAKGLICLNEQRLKSVKRTPYKMSVTEVLVNGHTMSEKMLKQYSEDGFLQLSTLQNNVEIHFSSKNFTDPSSMGFEYRMEGVDSIWKVVIGTNVASYFNLPGGDYVFHVRVMGDPSNEQIYKIHIDSVSSIWYWIFGLLFVLALAFFARNYIILLKDKLHQKKIEKELVISKLEERESSDDEKQDDKYKTNRLSEEECKTLSAKLSKYMQNEKPYTSSELKIGDLAKALNVSSHSLSYLFNQYLHQNYYDYINDYRVRLFKEMANDTRYSKYTLDALAELCGFSSRASFFRSFKKSVGITPNEYLNSLK